MPEYCTRELELAINVFCRITLANACEGNCSKYAYEVSKHKNLLSTERVNKFFKVYLHDNLRNISSCNKLTSASAKPGSSLLNYIRNKM